LWAELLQDSMYHYTLNGPLGNCTRLHTGAMVIESGLKLYNLKLNLY